MPPTTKAVRTLAGSRPSRPARLTGRALALAVMVVPGCVMAMSPADLARAENHAYPGRTQPQVFGATVTALRSMGYEIVTADGGSGLIKTAPKLVVATAHGSNYGAVATENSIAWTIGVTAIAGGVGVHADPRGYSGGRAVPVQEISATYLQPLFDTLYGELESNLPPPLQSGLGLRGAAH